ncbi:MAG: cobalamin-independent methionine synthase II family protein [Verrucomicrobiota bacterium]|nr:cobalamin-independent methionine synthase II family protein [Verrucomicrobiota bacterium]
MKPFCIQTQVVGSYPVPQWLQSSPSSPNQKDALLAVMKLQELAGLDMISDGELTRFDVNHPATNGMIEYFIRPMGGISDRISREEWQQYQRTQGMHFRSKPPGIVTDSVHEGQLNLPNAWKSIRKLSSLPIMFTLTSPYMLAKTLIDRHYGDLQLLTHAIARVLANQVSDIDAPMIQIDEAHLPGHPEDAAWAHEPINLILSAIRGEKAMHLCFGNYGGQSIQKGMWNELIAFFNRLKLDHLVLEFARRGYDELDAFKALKPEIALGIGVIDIKDNEVESPEEVARRIEKASKVVGVERIRWVHPDCGFWMLPRSVADQKMRNLVLGRNLFEGRQGQEPGITTA